MVLLEDQQRNGNSGFVRRSAKIISPNIIQIYISYDINQVSLKKIYFDHGIIFMYFLTYITKFSKKIAKFVSKIVSLCSFVYFT